MNINEKRLTSDDELRLIYDRYLEDFLTHKIFCACIDLDFISKKDLFREFLEFMDDEEIDYVSIEGHREFFMDNAEWFFENSRNQKE